MNATKNTHIGDPIFDRYIRFRLRKTLKPKESKQTQLCSEEVEV